MIDCFFILEGGVARLKRREEVKWRCWPRTAGEVTALSTSGWSFPSLHSSHKSTASTGRGSLGLLLITQSLSQSWTTKLNFASAQVKILVWGDCGNIHIWILWSTSWTQEKLIQVEAKLSGLVFVPLSLAWFCVPKIKRWAGSSFCFLMHQALMRPFLSATHVDTNEHLHSSCSQCDVTCAPQTRTKDAFFHLLWFNLSWQLGLLTLFLPLLHHFWKKKTSKNLGFRWKQVNNWNQTKYNIIIITTIIIVIVIEKGEGQGGVSPKTRDGQHSSSPPADWCPSWPWAAIGGSWPAPPGYTLGMRSCGMECPSGHLGSAVIALFPPQLVPEYWKLKIPWFGVSTTYTS